MPVENVLCNICDTDCSQFLFEKGGFNVVQCKQCGLVYMNPRHNIEEIKEIYHGDYSAGYIEKKEKKRKRARKILKGIMRYKKEGNFLDIGCSAGFILEAARDRGFESFGVEISPIGYKFSKEELGLNVFNGYLEDAKYPDNFFDVVTIYHVIEHVPDPKQLFNEVRRILKSDGIFEIWTPDVGHKKVRREGIHWINYIRDHLYYFDSESMSKILDKTGMYIFKNQWTQKDGLKIYARRKDFREINN